MEPHWKISRVPTRRALSVYIESGQTIFSMRTKRCLCFLCGCVSGLVLTSTALCIIYFVSDSTQLNGHQVREYYAESQKLQRILSGGMEKKKSTLSVVLSSPMQLASTFRATINSWGQMTTDWKIAVGGISGNSSRLKQYGHNARNYILAAELCDDFWPYSIITAKNLFCLLSAIHRTISTDYDWIVVIPDKTYLGVNELRNLLDKLDPNASHYIGYPSDTCKSNGLIKSDKTCLSYCSLQHTLILSQTVLSEVVTKHSMCLCDKNLRGESILKERYGDISLGRCLKKNLFLKCSDSLLEYQVSTI